MTAEYRDLLAAVLEALTLPEPATPGDIDRYRQVLEDRAMYARVALRSVLEVKDTPAHIANNAARLREHLVLAPPTSYRTADRSANDEESGR
jgi:hypothetical protein